MNEENVMDDLTWDEFQKVELRVGTIIAAEIFKEARKPAFKLQINFGNKIGIKKSSAQITDQYKPSELVGKQIVAVTNFPKKQIGPMMSECLVLDLFRKMDQLSYQSPIKRLVMDYDLLEPSF